MVFSVGERMGAHGRLNLLDDELHILKNISTTLWGLYSGSKPSANIQQGHQAQMDFELALTEGSMTNKSAKYMKQRERTYQGDRTRRLGHSPGRPWTPAGNCQTSTPFAPLIRGSVRFYRLAKYGVASAAPSTCANAGLVSTRWANPPRKPYKSSKTCRFCHLGLAVCQRPRLAPSRQLGRTMPSTTV